MRTFLFGLPFDLLRNELLIGTFSEMRDNDEVDDENEGVGDKAGWRLRLGNEFERGVSFTFNFTLNMALLSVNFPECTRMNNQVKFRKKNQSSSRLLMTSSLVFFFCRRVNVNNKKADNEVSFLAVVFDTRSSSENSTRQRLQQHWEWVNFFFLYRDRSKAKKRINLMLNLINSRYRALQHNSTLPVRVVVALSQCLPHTSVTFPATSPPPKLAAAWIVYM